MRKVWCQKLSKDMMVSFECTFDFIDDDGNKQFCIDGYPEDEIKSFIDSGYYSFDEDSCLSQDKLQHMIEEMNSKETYSLYIDV